MRRLLTLFLILLAAIGLGLLLRMDTGYALLGWGGWTVEMSLSMLTLSLIIGITLLYFLFRSIRAIVRAPRRVRARLVNWRRRRARIGLTRGLIDLAEGRWEAAENGLAKWAEYSETPLINYLVAARAAQLQGAHRRRDVYLKNAYEQTPSATVAVLLTQAELQLAHGQHEHALATLRRLQELSPGHRFGLRLLVRAYQAVEDWESLHRILPEMRKRRVFPDAEAEAIERDCCCRLLRAAGRRGQKTAVTEIWQGMPRRLRREQSGRLAYVRALLAANAQQEAESELEDSLKRQWNPDMVLLYGTLEGGDPERRLRQAEQWLRQHPGDGDLLLSLARLCIRTQLWGKARQYLDQSIAAAPRPDSYEELGRLLEHMDETVQASAAYRKGLELAVKRSADIPGTTLPAVPRPGGGTD